MMLFKNLIYDKPFLIDRRIDCNNNEQRLYLEKTFFKVKGTDQYFIKCYLMTNSGKMICQGFIYFYLDFINCTSEYIETLVKPEYRNSGIASLLTASWIKLCLENGIYNLGTIKKQRKPFLLYLLKTYSFELQDTNVYKRSNNSIHICKKQNDLTKYLLFDNPSQKLTFKGSSILKGDNYLILDSLDQRTMILDSVMLSNRYFLQDENKAYNKAVKTYSLFKK